MDKRTLIKIMPLITIAVLMTMIPVILHAQGGDTAKAGEFVGSGILKAGKAIGAGLAIGLAGIGAGYAIGVAGASGLSALTEKPEMMSQVLLIVALGEGVAIYGLLISILVLFTG